MPTWNHQTSMVEQIAAANHAFIKQLWGASGKELRDKLFDQADKGSLNKLLAEKHGFKFPPDVQFILVDIEGARTKRLPEPIDEGGPWYAIVMPPIPARSTDDEYQSLQLWSEASFHASNDGYGM